MAYYNSGGYACPPGYSTGPDSYSYPCNAYGYDGYPLQPDMRFPSYDPDLKYVSARHQQRRSIAGMFFGFFFPWAWFVLLFWAFESWFRHSNWSVCIFLAVLGFLFVGYLGISAAFTTNRKFKSDPEADPTWWWFLFVTTAIACTLGIVLGNINWTSNNEAFYDQLMLNVYVDVDPSNYTGSQMMDAGRIHFTDTSRVDVTRSMGFRNYDTYCVAPITVGEVQLNNYDFWAIGKNCCNGTDGKEYTCGEFDNLAAHSGLRLMDEKDRSYFRLAVEQAEAAYNIHSGHAIFMYFMADVDTQLQSYYNDGLAFFITGISVFGALQFFLVVLMAFIQYKFL